MVTCKLDTKSKMNRPRKSSSSSSGFRLLDGDQLDTVSSISRNSYYKLKIDSMFDDSRSVISQRLDDRRGSRRTGSIIMYGKNDLHCNRSILCDNHNQHYHTTTLTPTATTPTAAAAAEPIAEAATSINNSKNNNGTNHNNSNNSSFRKDVRRISNSVQAQIERMFTDVVKDATACSFPVKCLGSLALQQKVISLQGLQDPLRQLYLSGTGHGSHNSGQLDICPNTGLRIKTSSDTEPQITPFHNIAVWSAVKFVVSPADGGAAFLPLITDPENIDKASLFRPLTAADQRRLTSGLHAPIFAVVMRSSGIPKLLECHGFVCQTPEDAIVIAATLYQSLMAHVSTNSTRNTKRRTPRNQNGVSCISIASSAAFTSQNKCPRSPNSSVGRKNSSNNLPIPTPTRPERKKRSPSSTPSTSPESDSVCEITETTTTTEEHSKKKSHKTRRAPPIPLPNKANKSLSSNSNDIIESSISYLDKQSRANNSSCLPTDSTSGDILTRVAIPRSGSFLNTSGLTRYKSRVSRRNCGKIGGGGGSPLGFSELFNEFRLHENLNSLDEILNAIINADGMSFNDLKPIYKEFLMKLAVTLTKDELYQRSKNIMRRQKKKKLKRRKSCVPKNRGLILSAKGLKNVFWLGQLRSCKFRKFTKSAKNKQLNPAKSRQMMKNHHHDGIGRNGTSASDVSDLRNENLLNGINRNSSSGYVSCSECSYDSEACTCTSADRCYCSLGANHHNQVNDKLTKNGNRDSLITCRTDDKCYCSMDDTLTGDDRNDTTSETTTWCDSDSCISNSKCYCKQKKFNKIQQETITTSSTNKWTNNRKNSKKLGLDYELFTVGCSGKSVKPHEALSVKKSAEAAATFADLKIVQTTDIKSFETSSSSNMSKHQDSIRSKYNSRSRSSSVDDLLSKLDRVAEHHKKRKNSLNCNNCCYQSMKVGSTSLEDSLGYLP